MASPLLGFPAYPDASGAIAATELGEVAIYAEPSELRALGQYLLQAARELEAGVSQVEAFTFDHTEPSRNTPTQLIVYGRKR
jgi:hypothetical protein